jgi:hypothetical protein
MYRCMNELLRKNNDDANQGAKDIPLQVSYRIMYSDNYALLIYL